MKHWSGGYHDSAVSSQPRDSTDDLRDSRGHCENFVSDPLHPVGTAQTWIRTLTSRYCDYLDNNPVCMPLHSVTLSVDVISHLSEWLVGWTSSPSTRVFPLVGIIDTLPQSLRHVVTADTIMWEGLASIFQVWNIDHAATVTALFRLSHETLMWFTQPTSVQ